MMWYKGLSQTTDALHRPLPARGAPDFAPAAQIGPGTVLFRKEAPLGGTRLIFVALELALIFALTYGFELIAARELALWQTTALVIAADRMTGAVAGWMERVRR